MSPRDNDESRQRNHVGHRPADVSCRSPPPRSAPKVQPCSQAPKTVVDVRLIGAGRRDRLEVGALIGGSIVTPGSAVVAFVTLGAITGTAALGTAITGTATLGAITGTAGLGTTAVAAAVAI